MINHVLPFLSFLSLHLSLYNKQQEAEVLFFVLDNQTRSTSAMIEVAYYLGMGQSIVLVVNNDYYPGMTIEGEVVTER